MHKVVLILSLFFAVWLIKSPACLAFDPSWNLVYPSINESTYISSSLSNPSVVYASIRKWTDIDILKSTNSGKTWSSVKNNLPSAADVNWISIYNQNSDILAISIWGTNGGIFLSENGGVSWSKIFTSTTPRSVAIDPENFNTIYIGIGGNNPVFSGVYKTIDKGLHWQIFSQLGSNNNAQISINPENHNFVLADSDPNFYRSTDGGLNWTPLPISNTYSTGSVFDNKNGIIYTGKYTGSLGVYSSSDYGNSWIPKNTGFDGYPFHISQNDNGDLYVSNGSSQTGKVWTSKDGGDTWQNIGDPSWGNRNTWGLDISNNRILVSVEGLGIYYADLTPPKPNPVVFVPGLGGSWSTMGLLTVLPTTYSDWRLSPFYTQDYTTLLSGLRSAGLQDDQNLFTFGYDWRQSIETSASWLNDYIKTEVLPKNPGQKVNILGHSLGGLVIRACMQQFTDCKNNIDKVITAGSPHTGAVDAYYLWAGGEITEKDLLHRTAEEILLRINARHYPVIKDYVQTNLPSIREILPTFDYINGLSYGNMSAIDKNPFLESIGTNNLLPNLITFAGNNKDTTRNLTVKEPNWSEKSAGLWADGKPISRTPAVGDDTVLKESATLIGALKNNFFDTYHGGLVSDPAAQQEILNTFGLTGTPSATPPKVTRGLVFIMHSPATITVSDSLGHSVGTNIDDKMVFVENPISESYKISVIGTDTGHYDVDIGTFEEDKTDWREISGSTSTGKIDSFSFYYDDSNLQTNSVEDEDGTLHLKMAGEEFPDLNTKISKIITMINRHQYKPATQNLETLYKQLMIRLARTSDSLQRYKLKITAEYILQSYGQVTKYADLKMDEVKFKKDLKKAEKFLNSRTDSDDSLLLVLNYLDANQYFDQATMAGYQYSFYQKSLLINGIFPLLNAEED